MVPSQNRWPCWEPALSQAQKAALLCQNLAQGLSTALPKEQTDRPHL